MSLKIKQFLTTCFCGGRTITLNSIVKIMKTRSRMAQRTNIMTPYWYKIAATKKSIKMVYLGLGWRGLLRLLADCFADSNF